MDYLTNVVPIRLACVYKDVLFQKEWICSEYIYILTNRFVHAYIIKECFETNYFIFILRLKQVFYFIFFWGGVSKLKKLGFVSHLALYVYKTMFWFKRVGIFIINVRLQLLCIQYLNMQRDGIYNGRISLDRCTANVSLREILMYLILKRLARYHLQYLYMYI